MDTAVQPSAPTSLAAFLETYPTGDRFQGCYVVGRHPILDNAVLLLAPKAIGETEGSWSIVQEKFAQIEIEGNADFRALDRIESLFTFMRLARRHAMVPEFQEGGAEQFEEVWHWTGETLQFGPSRAWAQAFGDGSTDGWGKRHELRARAGRILTFNN